ncbi:hypothetical protein AGJ43_21150 [Cronobacter dublinensis subsp. dublinensis]|nr:hypothetical protein [Cronobacter dublinensis subsp. dublinensis]
MDDETWKRAFWVSLTDKKKSTAEGPGSYVYLIMLSLIILLFNATQDPYQTFYSFQLILIRSQQ